MGTFVESRYLMDIPINNAKKIQGYYIHSTDRATLPNRRYQVPQINQKSAGIH